jgi:hypothetical protein
MAVHWRRRQNPIFRAEVARPIFRPARAVGALRARTAGIVSRWQFYQKPALAAGTTWAFLRPGQPSQSLTAAQRKARQWLTRVLLVIFVLFMVRISLPLVQFVLWDVIVRLAVALLLLILLVAFAPWLWRMPAVLAAAVPVAREVENRRWYLLRSTPFSAGEIVAALHAASTYRVRKLWVYVTIMRLLMIVLLVAATLPFIGAAVLEMAGQEAREGLLAIDWRVFVLCALYITLEPFLDVAIDGALGVLASTLSDSQTKALFNGFVLRLLLWMLSLLSLLVILPITDHMLPPDQAQLVPLLALIGPAYGLLLGFSPAVLVVSVLGVTALRLLALNILMRAAAWRAATMAV